MLNAIIIWLHIISVLIWIGGMFFTLFVLKPSLNVVEEKKGQLLKAVMDRFFIFVWVSIIILLITGGMKAHLYINSIYFDLKLLIYFIMVLVFSYIYFGLYKKIPTSDNKPLLFAKISNLIKLNFTLGLIVIFLIEIVRYVG